jgi:osmotically-inducible protein OsmY
MRTETRRSRDAQRAHAGNRIVSGRATEGMTMRESIEGGAMTKGTVTTATRKRADQLASRLRGTELEQRASELAERIRQSEILAKAKAKAAALAKAQAKTEALAAKAQAKAEELAVQTQDEGSELTTRAKDKGERLAGRALRPFGKRLSEGRSARLLGIEPRRRVPVWLLALLGTVGGCAIGLVTASKCRARAATPLADKIRSELANDPRTAELPNLDVNVANGTVFVRGSVPSAFHEEALRDVITRVPGVHDVDLQVTAV